MIDTNTQFNMSWRLKINFFYKIELKNTIKSIWSISFHILALIHDNQ